MTRSDPYKVPAFVGSDFRAAMEPIGFLLRYMDDVSGGIMDGCGKSAVSWRQ